MTIEDQPPPKPSDAMLNERERQEMNDALTKSAIEMYRTVGNLAEVVTLLIYIAGVAVTAAVLIHTGMAVWGRLASP